MFAHQISTLLIRYANTIYLSIILIMLINLIQYAKHPIRNKLFNQPATSPI